MTFEPEANQADVMDHSGMAKLIDMAMNGLVLRTIALVMCRGYIYIFYISYYVLFLYIDILVPRLLSGRRDLVKLIL